MSKKYDPHKSLGRQLPGLGDVLLVKGVSVGLLLLERAPLI